MESGTVRADSCSSLLLNYLRQVGVAITQRELPSSCRNSAGLAPPVRRIAFSGNNSRSLTISASSSMNLRTN
jgi:hypothetical protein